MTTNILKILEPTDIWPGKNNAFMCECLNTDNTKYTTAVPKAEVAIFKYMLTIKHKLTQTEVVKLYELIEDYGQEKYEEACDQASIDEAGEDI